MVVKEEASETPGVQEEFSPLDSLKCAARSIEKSLGGSPIEQDAVTSVVKAIGNCKDIPDNLIRGLSLVVASNALNNVDLNHGPFAILQALHAVDYTKTVEFFTSALARQMRSTSLRVSYDKRMEYIRKWLLLSLSKYPKRLSPETIADTLIIVAEISLHLPNKPLPLGMYGLTKTLNLPKMVEILDARITLENAWKVQCLAALLLRSLASERKRRIDKNGQNGPVSGGDSNKHLLSKLWLKAFTNAYFSAKIYPGDDVFHFADGFKHLQNADLDDVFRSSLRKFFLRMPEVALPTLAILFETEHPFPVEIVNLVVELIPDVFSSTTDILHEYTARIISQLLYFTDTIQRKKLLVDVFGKQSKIKNRNEYPTRFAKVLNSVYPGYGQQTLEHFEAFISEVFDFLEGELQAVKTDSANNVRLLTSLGPHVNEKTPFFKKYIDLAASMFKQQSNNFPLVCTHAAAALVFPDLPTDMYPQTQLFDSIKQHIPLFANAITPADFVFFSTLLLFKLSRDGKDPKKTDPLLSQIFNSDAYLKEKFLTTLSTDAVEHRSPEFIRGLFDCLNSFDHQTISKLPTNPAVVRFTLLLLEWHSKMKLHPALKISESVSVLKPSILSWLFSAFADFLNSGEFEAIYMKQVDSSDPHNLFDSSRLLVHSHFINKLPSILEGYTSSREMDPSELCDLVFNVIILANNTIRQDETMLKNLSKILLQRSDCSRAIFEDFFNLGYIYRVYSLEPLRCRQNIIGFLVGLESENARHRNFAWEKCKELCEQMEITKLDKIEEKEAAIFFTADGALYNTGIIDEYSDAVLDKNNLRRENKAYKFKDQIAEIELRKELAEKNKREGKLTQRQQDAIKRELAKESEIRKELAPLFHAPRQLAELLPVVVRSDPNGALMNYQIFQSYVAPTLKSRLIGKLMLECVEEYLNTFFADSSDYLRERVLSALLRSTRSHLVHPEWSWEHFPDQLSKILSSLQMLCMMNNLMEEQDAIDALEQLQNENDDGSAFNEGITFGKVALIIPILDRIFTDPKVDERLRREATNFLKSAFSLDFLTVEERQWIPIKLINELLLQVMCDPSNVDYFDDIFQLMQGILRKLNEENSASEHVGNYVKRLINQLRNTNEIIREHVAKLLMLCKGIIENSCVKVDDIPHLTVIVIATKDVYRKADNTLHELIEELGIVVKPEMHDYIVNQLVYPHQFWQKAAATTLCLLFEKHTVRKLEKVFVEFLEVLPSVKDQIGRIITPEKDQWDSRLGVAFAFEFYIESDLYDTAVFKDLFEFLVPDGIGDENEIVRRGMYKATSSLISRNGAQQVDFVLPYLEKLLTDLPNTSENDILRNGIVCLLGTLARYLEPDSPKLRTIFARLMDALLVPARQVQESVALCLPPLATLLKDCAMDELRRLFRSLPQAKKYAERVGFAYGVAGLTKGLGLSSLREIGFMITLLEWFESKDLICREAVCLQFMTMCFVHRRAFDPYIRRLLQPLIKTFGDADDKVRAAAQDAGAQMLKIITPQAAKVFLPEILSGLDSEVWRAKCASAGFLGNISNCAPNQLSECLPKVVPGLANLMTDSHQKVKASGIDALKQIATVITNPEILAISSHLIKALVEPAKETTRALQIIVNTKFIHFIDPPALALIMPIIRRALNERDPVGRKLSANVVTNIFAIAEEKDVEPYVGMLIPSLKHSLLDPAPEVRSSAAQAIGIIVKHNTDGVFSTYTTDLIPWLKEKMMNKTSLVDRLGASQGMAEIISALEKGTEESVMAQAIEIASDPTNDPSMRDGYISLFKYLPTTMQQESFIPYIEKVIPPILLALGDETEYLRNSALHTGQILISTYASQAKRCLLPSLLESVIDENWRIRSAAVTLIGDFLFNITGLSSKMTSDTQNEDDTMALQNADKTILKYVGQKSRDRIIVSLYLARFDASVQVRQSASHIWKLVVSNTPRTVKDLLLELFNLVVYCISTSSDDRRVMAVDCLSEIVRKMGERIMESLIPGIEKALDNDKTVDHRRGSIEALSVVITASPSSEVFENYNKEIVRIFRVSLCDPDLRLRQSAGETFAVYHNRIGISAIQEIVDPFFSDYAENESEATLDGIVAILSVNRRGRVLTVPSLVKRILAFKSRAYVLSRLVDLIGDTIERNFIQIFDAMFDGKPNPLTDEYFGHCASLLKAVRTNYLIVGLYKYLAIRAVNRDDLAVRLMTEMIKLDVIRDETLGVLIENTVVLYTSEHLQTQTAGSRLMSSLISKCSQNEKLGIPTYLCAFAVGIRNRSEKMHGLGTPEGWKPFTELLGGCLLRETIRSYISAIFSRSGSMDQKEAAVHTIADFLEMTESTAGLRLVTPSLVAVLLRLLADKCSTPCKLHSVRIVSILMQKVPESTRAFAPQLANFMQRILQESEIEAMVPDTALLVELTEDTLEKLKSLIPGRQ